MTTTWTVATRRSEVSANRSGPNTVSDTTAAGVLTAATDGSYLLGLNAAGTHVRTVPKSAAWQPGSMTDAEASNGSVYFSTTQSKLVYKDGGGVVHALY